MRFLKVGLLALCGLLLSACVSFQLNVTDLMQSPKLTEDQTEIYEALTTAAGVSDVQLKYPKRGNYRSSFVLFDLDADGVLSPAESDPVTAKRKNGFRYMTP